MCRFLAYRGSPLVLADLVYRPSNSLIHQATDAMESRTRINADGFGLGWYNFALSPEPAVFKDTTPAWSNRNLRSVAEKVTSECVFAHVRAALHNDPVTRANCHPFRRGPLLWMHNGDVPGRGRLHRRIAAAVDPELIARIEGNTDTELVFVLFQSLLRPPLDRRFETDELVAAMRGVIRQVTEWWREDGEGRPLELNLCLTDGRTIVASRFGRGEAPPSLYWCLGARYVFDDGAFRVETADDGPGCALIASERLSEDPHWQAVAPDRLVVVREGLDVSLEDLSESAAVPGA